MNLWLDQVHKGVPSVQNRFDPLAAESSVLEEGQL